MPFVLKAGQGALHRNDKEGIESRPDYTGELNIEGALYRLAGWIKPGQGGKHWLSLNCELPRAKAALETSPPPRSRIDHVNPDDDIPF